MINLQKRTHLVSFERYAVVLNNMEALKGIHHVSDEVLFEEKLTHTQKTKIIKIVNDNSLTQSFDNTHWITDMTKYKCIINCETGYLDLWHITLHLHHS